MNARLAVAPAVGLRARGRPLAPLPAAADALGGAPSAPSSTASSPATKLYPNLDLDFVPAMTPAEWARGLALAVFTGALHAAFVAKLFTQRLTAGSSPWYVTVAPTLAVAVLTFAIHRYLALEAKEQSRLIPETAAADPDSLFTNVDDVNVHYKLRRPKKGPPRVVVSCCHGFGANTYSWERCAMSPLAEALGAAVVAHDSPGFGLTARPHDLSKYLPKTNGAISRAMLDVASVAYQSMEQRTVPQSPFPKPRRVVMGHSMGGIAAAVAAGAGDVDDVVLVAPALIPPRVGVKPRLNPNPKPVSLMTALCGALGRFATAVAVYALAPFLKLFLRKIVRSATFWRRGLSKAVGRKCAPVFFTDMSWADGYRRPSCVKGWDDGMVRVVLAAATAGVNDVWAAESAKVAAAIRKESPATCDALEDMSTDAAATLEALRCSGARVLIVHGDEDAIVPLENSRRLADALGGGDADVQLVVMRGCGHMPHEEDPDVFVEAVKSFVGEWNPRPTVRAKKP